MDNNYFMGKALEQARAAFAAGEFPVGCVIIHNDGIIATGSRSGTTGERTNETDHAEMTALQRLNQTERAVDHSETTLFCTMEPCLMCFGAILLSGIGKIVYAYEDIMGGATACDRSKIAPLYKNNPISIVPHILRRESLLLFKRYFQRPENAYLRNSRLAQYTINHNKA